MNALIPLQFETHALRMQLDGGAPWFNANDVCEALEMGNASQAIKSHVDPDDLQKLEAIDALGRAQSANHINESGLYSLILGSTKDAAKRFKRWVTSEVLPSIRQTGTYTTPAKPKDQFRHVAAELRGALQIAKLIGLPDNQALLNADKALRRMYGVSPLALLESEKLVSEVQQRFKTPTELGLELGESAIAFNQRLKQHGFQVKPDGKNWIPTDKGRPYAILVDSNKAQGRGTSVQHLHWYESVLDALREEERPKLTVVRTEKPEEVA